MNYNEDTFWDNTQGQFSVIKISEHFNDIHDLVAKELHKKIKNPITAIEVRKILQANVGRFVLGYDLDGDKMLLNFNKDKTAFFIRCKDHAIRISKEWGKVGNCNWWLYNENNDSCFDHYTAARIEYKDLKPFNAKG